MTDDETDGGVDPLGPSIVARGHKPISGRSRALGVLACAGVVGLGLTWALWPKSTQQVDNGVTKGAFSMGESMPEQRFRIVPAPQVIPVMASVPAPRVAPTPPATSAVVVAPPPARSMGFWEDRNASAIAPQNAAMGRGADPSGAKSADPDVASPKSEYADRMRTTQFADAEPRPHHFHTQYTIKKGTVFPCTPSSPISSALPGPVQCTTDIDVWSMDGTVILLPRGTQINGTIERGLANGDQRLFLVWTDALTPRPDLLAIPLGAPAADELGLTGVPGDVDDHLWRKVKAALLVSMVDIGANVATGLAQRGNGNTNINLGGLSGQATSLGQTALGHDLNIPATLYRAQGQPLSVYVPKYIDLFHFYSLAPRY